MDSVVIKIMRKIDAHGQGYVFTPNDFLDFGSRQAVDTALSRLVAQSQIRRLARGLYDYPKKHHLLGDLLPSLDDVAQAVARSTDSHIQISGAKALHLLGVTTQVPAQTVYLTDGRSKAIQIGNAVLKLKHASSRVMTGAGSKAGTVLQALRYLGKDHIDDSIVVKFANQLDDNDKKALKKIARFAPGWTKPSIDKMVNM